MGVEVLNFGCRLNIAEGEAIRVAAAGLEGVTIVNSCAVTNEAVRQAKQAVRRAARAGQRVIATGCAAQLDPAAFAAMPGVSAVLSNSEKRMSPFPVVEGAARSAAVGLTPVVSGPAHTRAFVEVQTGCDHRCTFCIIPFARGDSISAAPDAVIDAIRAAVDRGQHEAVLTGVDVTSYEGGLGALVARILRDVPALPRLRLSSIDPHEIDPLLFKLIADEPRLMPHVHLSLQAGDDMILKRMKRRHSRSEAVALATRLKAARPEIAIGADLIAGFPTEDDVMAANSARLIADCDIVFGHIFPYSPRHGTPAARMPQVPNAIARQRAARLRAAVAARKAAWLATLIGSTQRVLIENDGRGGHAENFARVDAAGKPGSIVDVRIDATDGDRLSA